MPRPAPKEQAASPARRRRWGPALLCLGAASLLAGAEPPPLTLTLAQALRTALEQNPDVHRSLLAIAQSQEDRRSAAAALKPAVQADAQGQRLRLNLDTELGTATRGGPEIAGPYTWGIAEVQASVPVFDLTLWSRWKAARHEEATAEARAKEVRESITALVVGQYLRIQRSAA